jgi:C4-type Zn-finger protein
MTTEHEQRMKLSAIAADFAEGKPHEVHCPICGHSTLALSFSRMKSPFYGVFVVCRHCGNGQHLTLSERPPGFREELVLPEFQALEDDAVKGTILDRHGGIQAKEKDEPG